MTLIIQKPTGAKLNLAQTYVGIDDPDAAAYITAVETADGQSLETATKVAIHSFVKGCKSDGIWPAIKASCILAGARTLTGALVPLVGAAPTNVGGLFVSGDYNRKTGLVGDGSTKYLNSNRASNADPQNNRSIAAWISTAHTSGVGTVLGAGQAVAGSSAVGQNATAGEAFGRLSSLASLTRTGAHTATGLIAANRTASDFIELRVATSNSSGTTASVSPVTTNYLIFARNAPAAESFANARLAFYSIGESLDLALLDARVTDLINAFAAAIP
jgi:hypothetical protein